MGKRILLVICAFTLFFSGCAATPPKSPESRLKLSPEAMADLERKQMEKMDQEAKAFEEFNKKVDEYQDLLAACDGIPENDESGWLKDSCNQRLKRLRQELVELAGRATPETAPER